MPKVYFPRVKEAREALRERAIEILETYLTVVNEARAKGDFETALDGLKWLVEHMPNEEGERMVDVSAAKPTVGSGGGSAPQPIQIGIALGGLRPKELPAITQVPIDIKPS